MDTLLGRRLEEAIERKGSDINSFVWKGVKTLDADGRYRQNERRLVDMNQYDLNVCYDHCKKMLFNKEPQNPGRYVVLDLISEQKDKCGAELFLRYVEQEHNLSRYTLMSHISNFKKTNKDFFRENAGKLKDMFSNLPSHFEILSLDLITDGCLDRLGAFNKKHITRTFILKQGIWLTPTESKELMAESHTHDRLEVIRENLNLKEVEKLYINSKGINYTQMRAMLGLKPNKKYSDLTTNQLDTLRNRILFNLEEAVKNHIYSWEKRMEEIEKVAEHNNYKI